MQIVPMLAMAIFLAYNHGKLNSGDPSELSVREQIVGSWQSENLGLDFPMWFVNTYHADGKVTCDLYVKPKDEVIHHESSTRIENWRVVENTLEIGKFCRMWRLKSPGGRIKSMFRQMEKSWGSRGGPVWLGKPNEPPGFRWLA